MCFSVPPKTNNLGEFEFDSWWKPFFVKFYLSHSRTLDYRYPLPYWESQVNTKLKKFKVWESSTLSLRATIQVSWMPHVYLKLKALNLWIISLIKCSIFTFLNNVRFNSSHTYGNNLFLKCESFNFLCS
jgi:hypothetical protein